MRIFDNGWYCIKSSTYICHYFFNDKPIHKLNHGLIGNTDYSKRYPADHKNCKRCIDILRAYSKIGLENRLI